MAPLPALFHQMMRAQDRQMLRNRGVADAEQPLQGVDVHFPLVQFHENAQPVRVGDGAQQLGQLFCNQSPLRNGSFLPVGDSFSSMQKLRIHVKHPDILTQ